MTHETPPSVDADPVSERSLGWPKRGQDARVSLYLSTQDAEVGGLVRVSFMMPEPCTDCADGTIADSGRPCPDCSLDVPNQDVHGLFAMPHDCATCQDHGRIDTEPCESCRGLLYKLETREVDVTLPPRLPDETLLRLEGEGLMGSESRGDILVSIRRGLPPGVRRERGRCVLVVPLSRREARLGGDLLVDTFSGNRFCTYHADTQDGHELTLEGAGECKLLHGQGYRSDARIAGDLIVRFVVPRSPFPFLFFAAGILGLLLLALSGFAMR